VGQKGTAYDASHIDYTFARVDGAFVDDFPGYFTYRSSIAPKVSKTVIPVAVQNIMTPSPANVDADINEDGLINVLDIVEMVMAK
jgi:hypothetical protein